jgi:hypothetical protein
MVQEVGSYAKRSKDPIGYGGKGKGSAIRGIG